MRPRSAAHTRPRSPPLVRRARQSVRHTVLVECGLYPRPGVPVMLTKNLTDELVVCIVVKTKEFEWNF